MHVWEDATSYSQGQRGKIEPNAWATRIGEFRLWVGRNHRACPGRWVMHGFGLGIDTAELPVAPDAPKEVAQAAAVDMARAVAKKMIADLQNI